MASVNKVILIGNAVADPEFKTLGGGTNVATFPLATTEKWKDKSGEYHEQTEWHNIVVWRQLADIAFRYIHKGDQIYVEGRITTRSWENKEGLKVYKTEIQCDTLKMLSSKKTDSPQNPQDSQQTETGDDLPF